jgi:ferritin-like metal-binding protein YciE
MEIAKVCDQNLQEELAMAEWLQVNLPQVTKTFMSRIAIGDDDAKR